jgi:hypothetical protein
VASIISAVETLGGSAEIAATRPSVISTEPVTPPEPIRALRNTSDRLGR